MSSSEEEDEVWARAAFITNQAIQGCTTLLEQANSLEDSPLSVVVKESGASAILKLKKGLNKYPFHEVGAVNFDDIEGAMQEFIFQYTAFSRERGNLKEHRAALSEMQLHMKALEAELNMDWNVNRPENAILNTGGGCYSGSSGNITKAVVVGNGTRGVKRSTSGHHEESPVAKQKKVVFRKISPKKELLQKLKCHVCPKTYCSVKALKKHLKEKHLITEVQGLMKEEADKITCRVCSNVKKIGRDLMTRHLRNIHKFDKPSSASELRGWFTIDEISWRPLWRLEDEEDPPEEISVPVLANGSVTIFGFTFDVNEVTFKNIREVDKGVQDKCEERLKSYDKVDQCFNDDNTVVEHMTYDRSDEKLVSKSIKAGAGEAMPISMAVSDGDGHMASAAATPVFARSVNTSSRTCGKYSVIHGEEQVELEAVHAHANVEGFDCDIEEELPDMGSMRKSYSIQERESTSVKRNLMDEFNDELLDSVEEDYSVDVNFNKTRGPEDKTKKVRVEVFDHSVKSGVVWTPDVEECDSDFEETDSKAFTDNRLQMKQNRFDRRNIMDQPMSKLSEHDTNKCVIEDFEEYMIRKKSDVSKSPSKLSTLKKAMGHLYNYDDSLLNFLSKSDQSFNLRRLVSPAEDNFINLPDPTSVDGWLQSIEGPGRRKEALKAHAQFRDYLKERLMQKDFGKATDDYIRREIVIKNLENIAVTIKKKKLFQKLQKLEEEERSQKQLAKDLINPSNTHNEQLAVQRWFDSKEAKEEEEKCLEIYNKTMNGQKPSSREFTRYGMWAKFSTCIEDKNRRSVYSFTNLEYKKRKPMWLPPPTNDVQSVVDQFQEIPDNWDTNVPPTLGAPPSCWVLEVSGEGLKGGNKAHIILTKRSAEICEKYRDIKCEVFDEEGDQDPFFVNLRRKPLTALQRTKGSLLDKLGKTCEVTDVTVNTFRRAAEVHVQSSPSMKNHVEKLQLHSKQTGLKYYDRTTSKIRASFINQVSIRESQNNNSDECDKIPENVAKKRTERDLIDRESVLNKAKETLLKDKKDKKETRNQKCKLLYEEREFMMKIFSPLVAVKTKGKYFPDVRVFKSIYYREVDSKSGEDGEKLRKIEESLFFSEVKANVVEELGPWTGSVEQNSMADMKISKNIKSSFRSYEKNRKKFDECYFKFSS